MKNNDLKQVIVLRKDLGMRKGKMCSQAAHASVRVVTNNMKDPNVNEWLRGISTKITVSVDSEEQLHEIYKNALMNNIICTLITDAGKTEFHGVATDTAVAIGPAPAKDVDKITKELKLL